MRQHPQYGKCTSAIRLCWVILASQLHVPARLSVGLPGSGIDNGGAPLLAILVSHYWGHCPEPRACTQRALLGLAERIPSPPGPCSRSLSPATTAALFPLHYTPSPSPPPLTTVTACYPLFHTFSDLCRLFYSLPLPLPLFPPLILLPSDLLSPPT